MASAPIVLFVYNRPWHTRETVERLKNNSPARHSDLIIYSDGPKSSEDGENVDAVRRYIKGAEGFGSITVIERTENLGLAESVISGVTDVVNEYGRVIVLEDDMVTSPYFLRYMNDALELYENEEKVISVHGYVYPVSEALPPTFFLRGADCWGWATWKRGWNLFEGDGEKLLRELKEKKLTDLFDFNGAHGYTRMLKEQIAGRNDSWAVRWYASAFLGERLTLYPGVSLVRNIGLDGAGTHCDDSNRYDVEPANEPVFFRPIEIAENDEVRRIVENYFRTLRPSFRQRVHRFIAGRQRGAH